MNKLLQDEKNIDSIFFYAINNDLNCLGFHYTANNKKYKKDYKDIDFKESIIRIKKVYEILKDKNKINLIGDLTKDIISGKVNIDLNKIYNKTLLNNDKYDYLTMLDYINFIINHTLDMINIDNKNTCVPLTFYKSDKGYKFKYRIVNGDIDYVFDSDINIFDKSIIVNINNNVYNGEIIFDRLNIDNEVSFKKDNKNIYSKYYDNTLNEEDKVRINKVFDMLDINYEIDGIKTLDNNYILYNSSDVYDYFIKLSIHDELIRVSLKSSNKYLKKDIEFRTDEEKYDILITKYNKDYLLVQKKYLMTLNGSNDFKQNINKSRYFILKRDNIGNIIDSNIVNKEEIEIQINSLEDINKLILKRD